MVDDSNQTTGQQGEGDAGQGGGQGQGGDAQPSRSRRQSTSVEDTFSVARLREPAGAQVASEAAGETVPHAAVIGALHDLGDEDELTRDAVAERIAAFYAHKDDTARED